MMSLSMTLSDPDPGFKVILLFKVNVSKSAFVIVQMQIYLTSTVMCC